MAANDAVRREYLDAMGITVWERRQKVVGALVTEKGADPMSAVDAPAAAPPPAVIVGRNDAQDRSTNEAAWAALEAEVRVCAKCPLHKGRTQTVFGVGDRHAKWLFVGEAPGAEEDKQGEPFVGRAGKLLNAMLFAIGLKREEVYITNVLKSRPPGNRDPRPEEVEQCEPYLRQQIALIQPKVIVALGRHAAHSLLRTEQPLNRLRGQKFSYQGIPLIVTYHPAYLLRSPLEKRKAWDDLVRARRLMETSA
jgi:DNA polymerase